MAKYDLGSIHPVWKKIPAIIDAFNAHTDAEWVFILDLDAIIMSPQQDLNSLLLSSDALLKALDLGAEFKTSGGGPTGYKMSDNPDLDNLDLLISQDHNGLNAGSFFVRRSVWAQMVLDFMMDPHFIDSDLPGQEQDALVSATNTAIGNRSGKLTYDASQAHLIVHHPMIRSHVGLLRPRIANAYAIGGEAGWQRGDLIVHFGGCWVHQECQQRWDQYWTRRAG